MKTSSPRLTSLYLSLVVAGAVLGFLMTVQLRSPAARLPSRDQSRLVNADAIRRLEEEQRSLKDHLAALRSDVTTLQHRKDFGSTRPRLRPD